ncbi:MAG: hypothetical protein NC041_02095 [Bacteroides sp.]|nr:hypothetical protein [Prevotella sp.]MCM1407606.1 hypothetical protein [Treponema brennaborense]MCM1469244.1 hypothetical protein [Bacteroides sp.]
MDKDNFADSEVRRIPPENRENFDAEDLVFHYRRERRLASAPESVQNLYNGSLQFAPNGLLKTLVRTKSSRMLLSVILAFSLMLLFLRSFAADSSRTDIAEISAAVSAFSFSDTVYVSVQCVPRNNRKLPPSRIFPSNKKNNDSRKSEKTADDFSAAGTSAFIEMNVQAYDSSGVLFAEHEIFGFCTNDETYFRTTFADYDIVEIRVALQIENEQDSIVCKVEKK